jgi:Uma2 family endonuclease
MATASALSLEEYLLTSFSPDVEYVDGELKERNVGSYEHARLQTLIGAWFVQNEKSWNVQGVTAQRTRTSRTNILIPDVALLPRGTQPRVIEQPPILAVEILSPEDRYSDLTFKIRKYLDWGVKAVWVIDPDTPVGQVWTAPYVCHSSNVLKVEGTAIYLDLTALFESLKES